MIYIEVKKKTMQSILAMAYNVLMRIVHDSVNMEGFTPEGVTKDDYLHALWALSKIVKVSD